jgi:hypothetical protein
MKATATQHCHPTSAETRDIPTPSISRARSRKLFPPIPRRTNKKTKNHQKHASPAGRIPSLKVPEITGLYPFVYRHKSGCGGDAFLMTRVPDGSEKISDCVSSVGHLNGDPMSGSERVKCETCGKSALPLNIDYLERVA